MDPDGGGGRKEWPALGGLGSDRSENTFLRLYDRLPEAAVYCSDRYAVYRWFPQDRHCAGKGGAVNWNEGCIRCCGASGTG